MYHEIGESLIAPDGQKVYALELQRGEECEDCALYKTDLCISVRCMKEQRYDDKDIIYKQLI